MEYLLNRYKNIDRCEYRLEVVTPLFLGGADPEKAEIRSASLKGALRFWWRALYGPGIVNQNSATYVDKKIQALKERENKLFGDQDHKSRITLVLTSNEKPIDISKGETYSVESSQGSFTLGIIAYLAYGLSKREYFKPETKVNLLIELQNLSNEDKEQILQALKALLLFGGLGSKTRNGFGCLYSEDIKGDYENILNKFRTNNLLDYTAFSSKTRLICFSKRSNWVYALSEIGIAYQQQRLKLENKHQYTKRGLIGRPIVQAKQTDISKGRHPKPFFLHVQKIGNQFQGQILFMPYHYYKKENQKDYMETCEELFNNLSEGVKIYEFPHT